MAVAFQNSTLQSLYDGTNADALLSADKLVTFRTGGDTTQDNSIASLDERIASFESALLGSLPAGKTAADFPYDRDGLKREFLDEVTGLLLLRSGGTGAENYAAAGILVTSDAIIPPLSITNPVFKGGTQKDIVKNATTGFGVFDDLDTTNTTNDTDPRLAMLTPEGQAIFKTYANLIDNVFAEGDKLADNPSRSVQLVGAMQPMVVDGTTYNRVAQVSGSDPVTKLPTYNTYLLESTAETSKVVKDGSGNAQLTGPASSTAKEILLSPFEAGLDATTGEYTVTVDGISFRISTPNNGVAVRTNTTDLPALAQTISPLTQNVPDRGTEFPDVRIVSSYQYTVNQTTYLIGLSTEGEVYVTSLSAARTSSVAATASLNGMEYLLFYNEARVKILKAQLSYKEAVVREIQDDLKKANAALAELETQSGAITANDKDGQPTGQFSADTITMSVFNAENSLAGNSLLARGGNDSYQNATDWATSRATLKNYIDRRSSEAQEATLDYQNTLNRYNNALEVMAKLQEKLDTLLKSQLHNFA